jgi:hypothetical protein
LVPFLDFAAKGGQIDTDLEAAVLDCLLQGFHICLLAIAFGVHDYFATGPGNMS